MPILWNEDAEFAAALRGVISWSCAILPPLAALEAFVRTSREQVFNLLLAEGACGSSHMEAASSRIFGHCPDCYAAAAQAGAVMMAGILMIDVLSGAGVVKRLVNSVRQ